VGGRVLGRVAGSAAHMAASLCGRGGGCMAEVEVVVDVARQRCAEGGEDGSRLPSSQCIPIPPARSIPDRAHRMLPWLQQGAHQALPPHAPKDCCFNALHLRDASCAALAVPDPQALVYHAQKLMALHEADLPYQ